MQLRDYQIKALSAFSELLSSLKAARTDEEEFANFQTERGRPAAPSDYARKSWEDLGARELLPSHMPYIDRRDGLGRVVPNACLKVPTGGG